jgi:hypothetical protein
MTRALLQAAIVMTLPCLIGCAYYQPALTQIRADLPVGSSLARVDSYLNQHQIEHSYYWKSNQVTAIIRNVRGDGLVQTDLNLVFSFDEYKTLRDILAKPAYIAP